MAMMRSFFKSSGQEAVLTNRLKYIMAKISCLNISFNRDRIYLFFSLLKSFAICYFIDSSYASGHPFHGKMTKRSLLHQLDRFIRVKRYDHVVPLKQPQKRLRSPFSMRILKGRFGCWS